MSGSGRDHAKTTRDLLALALAGTTQAEVDTAWGRALVVAREHGVSLAELLPPPPASTSDGGVSQERLERVAREAFDKGVKLGHDRGERRGYERGRAEAEGIARRLADQMVEEAVAALARGNGASLARVGDGRVGDLADVLAELDDGTDDRCGGFPPYVSPRVGHGRLR